MYLVRPCLADIPGRTALFVVCVVIVVAAAAVEGKWRRSGSGEEGRCVWGQLGRSGGTGKLQSDIMYERIIKEKKRKNRKFPKCIKINFK